MKIESLNQYQWDQNWPNSIAHTDIKLVVAELKAIEEVRGEITPELIVESSKNKNSVLHDYFEWDNDKAANSWRKQQASILLRRIEVKVIKDGEEKFFRAFEISKRDNFGGKPQYKTMDVQNSENIELIKTLCVADLRRVKNKIQQYSFDKAIEYIDKAIDELTKKEEAKEISLKKPVAV